MKCSNCDKDALYEYKITDTSSVFYCGKDLPKFLEARKNAGLLDITPKHTEAKNEAQELLAPETESKKKATKKQAE